MACRSSNGASKPLAMQCVTLLAAVVLLQAALVFARPLNQDGDGVGSNFNCNNTDCIGQETCCPSKSGGATCCSPLTHCCGSGSNTTQSICCDFNEQCCDGGNMPAVCCEASSSFCCPPLDGFPARCCANTQTCCVGGKYGCCDL
eukprot:c5897_g1_i1.p1 GENE.c5897_g1_i1~~c5897_g1_i1.p1  ORF type:complete len:145 (+),score=9.49 c5897_g1_i1:58-492(+)